MKKITALAKRFMAAEGYLSVFLKKLLFSPFLMVISDTQGAKQLMQGVTGYTSFIIYSFHLLLWRRTKMRR
ncbi:MAG: hypothetical protein SH857_12550 [Chitinophagales bacterium]|nr:hypothetical protein [Chitinophagales bacterium]